MLLNGHAIAAEKIPVLPEETEGCINVEKAI
jgi:hypothetical protein